jgi:hypothetical protein
MKKILLILSLTTPLLPRSQTTRDHGRVIVAGNHHDLQYEDGTPFFWLGDTGWELFHRLKKEEIAHYLGNRASKGFTVIQSVILAEFDGLHKPNAYGEVPFLGMDPGKPNEKYFELVDWTVAEAEKNGLIMGLLPTWGDKVTQLWGTGPVIFHEKNAYDYGLFLGKRYARARNIVWILGGDRPAVKDSQDWRPVWRAMAHGIRDGTGQRAFITYHPSGGENSTSQYLQQEDWLDMNMMQSGHGGGHDVPVWEWITRDRALLPAKPTLDAEPNYEDHPVNPWPTWDPANGYFRDHDVRKQTYRSVFAGACGVTYGHHAVWQFWSPREEKINHADRYWTEALDRPGARQVGYLRKLILSRPPMGRIPDPSMIVAGQGDKGGYMTAFHGADGTYGMVYLPVGRALSVSTASLNGDRITAWWYDPRNDRALRIGTQKKDPVLTFTPPQTGGENDWVLVLDDATKNYADPAKTKE